MYDSWKVWGVSRKSWFISTALVSETSALPRSAFAPRLCSEYCTIRWSRMCSLQLRLLRRQISAVTTSTSSNCCKYGTMPVRCWYGTIEANIGAIWELSWFYCKFVFGTTKPPNNPISHEGQRQVLKKGLKTKHPNMAQLPLQRGGTPSFFFPAAVTLPTVWCQAPCHHPRPWSKKTFMNFPWDFEKAWLANIKD